MTRRKNVTKVKAATSGKPAPTSFVVRQITAEDQALLTKVRRLTGAGNDSLAIARMLRDYFKMADRLQEVRTLYSSLAEDVAELIAESDQRDASAKAVEVIRKRLRTTGNDVHARRQRWMYEPTV